MALLSADELAKLTSDLAIRGINATSRSVRAALGDPEKKLALQRALQAGLVALLGTAAAAIPQKTTVLAEMFRRFLHSADIGQELGALLRGSPLDVNGLSALFKEANEGADIVPPLNVEQAILSLEAAFLEAASRELALDGTLQTADLLAQPRLQGNLLGTVRDLVAWLAQVRRETVGIQGEQIIAQNVVNGQQIIYQLGQRDDSLDEDWVQARRNAYLHHLFSSTRVLLLSGVDPKAAADTKAYLHLDAIYTVLLVTSSKPSFAGRFERRARELLERALRERELHERLERELLTEFASESQTALAALDRHPRLVLLGDPGGGKSTFVSFVALCLTGEALGDRAVNLKLLTAPLPAEEGRDSGNRQPWRHGALLPIRIILRDFAARGLPPVGQSATAEHVWRFIIANLEAASLGDYAPSLRRELLNKGGLILFDGLDEVPEADQRREQIKQAVEDFAGAFGSCRILVTSRTYAYQNQSWRLPTFKEAILAPFSAGQIRHFVDRWYTHLAELGRMNIDDAQGRAELLKKAVFGNDRLLALAERPLLLTLMASLHAWRGGSLPEKREELYADTVNLLLNTWESQRVVRDAKGNVVVMQPSLAEWLRVDRDKVRNLLNELAYKAHASQPTAVGTADVPENELLAGMISLSQNPDVKPARLVEYLRDRAGLLVPRGVSVYTFPHRTFQEYLAACYLTDHDFPDEPARLARTAPDRWREVVLLAGAKAARGSASSIWSLAEALCYEELQTSSATFENVQGALLAAQALLESANLSRVEPRNAEKLARVRRWHGQLLRKDDLPPIQRARVGVTLARLGDPRQEVLTLEEMEFCFVPSGPFMMGTKAARSQKKRKADHGQSAHRCMLPYAYLISRFPVTNAQFQVFIAAGGYQERSYWGEAELAGIWQDGKVKRYVRRNRINEIMASPMMLREEIVSLFYRHGHRQAVEAEADAPYNFNDPEKLLSYPVVGVTWYEALAFTRWLTAWLQRSAWLSDGWMVCLPSEAEWEKAARGGEEIPASPILTAAKNWKLLLLETPSEVQQKRTLGPQRLYPWGDKQDKNRANYQDTGVGTLSVVGCFPGGVSPYGVEELCGNVWEYTRSLWGKDFAKPSFGYPYNFTDGRENLEAPRSILRVTRGGSYAHPIRFGSCSWRGFGLEADTCMEDLGFRIVLVPARTL